MTLAAVLVAERVEDGKGRRPETEREPHQRGGLPVGQGQPLAEEFGHLLFLSGPGFEAGAIPTHVSDNVRGALWLKLIINCAYNAISALARKPYGDIVPSPGVRDVMRDIVDECLAVATAEGITVPGDVDAAVRRIVETIPQQYSSTAQDILRGKPTEIDYLNGHIVRRGAAFGIRTPANQVLWAMVKLIETK